MKIVSLGKSAEFLVPMVKIRRRKSATKIRTFLTEAFGSYYSPRGIVSGYYRPHGATKAVYDEHTKYRVTFQDDARGTKLRKLQRFLAKLCADIREECIYLECGGVAMTIRP